MAPGGVAVYLTAIMPVLDLLALPAAVAPD
jgi:hypothetical protein